MDIKIIKSKTLPHRTKVRLPNGGIARSCDLDCVDEDFCFNGKCDRAGCMSK